MASILRQRRDTAANWESVNPVVPAGQLCFDKTNNTFRIGDGVNTYSDLPVQSGTPGKGIDTIERTSGDGSVGTTDTYTITYTDATTTTFPVINGNDGTASIPEYDAATTYAAGNVVYEPTAGITYRCLIANTGEALDNETYWGIIGSGAGGDEIQAPTIISPDDGATDTVLAPTITFSKYYSLYSKEQAALQVQVSTVSDFATTVDDVTLGAVSSYTTSQLGLLSTYYVRGRYQDIDNTWSEWTPTVSFTTANITIQTPTAVSPTNGTIDVVETPVLTADAFACIGGTDTHASSSWKVFSDSGLTTVVYESLNDTSNLESITVPAGILLEGTTYYWQVKYTGTTYGDSEYSTAISFTTDATYIAIGKPLADGGIVACQQDGYWLVVAPATQRGTSIKWGLYGTDTSLTNISSASTTDPQDGKLNTDVLTSSTYNTISDSYSTVGCPPAEFCRALSADYFLPNKEELIAIQAVAADIDAADTSGGADTFAAMGTDLIWTSTECDSSGSWVVRASDGFVGNSGRANVYRVVPVRRIAI